VTVRVAVAQFAAGVDRAANRARVCEAIAGAARAGAALVVAPEYAMYFDPKRAEDGPGAEPLDGPFVGVVRAATRRAGISAVVGMTEVPTEPGHEGRAYNTALAVGADGELIGTYRKVHLYDAFGYAESDTLLPGEIVEPLVFDLGGIRFGVLTCYDLRFPEAARTLVDAGATAIALPAAWAVGPAKEDHWVTLVRARAIESTCYLVAAGQSGRRCTGQSMIVDPMGVILAGAGERPGLALAELDPARLEQVRRDNPCLRNRRFRVVAR
jgi:predicted amidohydrolase